jgi:hypothetical protein
MARTKKTIRSAKRSTTLHLLAMLGRLALAVAKLAWKVLALTGSHLAKRKLAELDQRHASPAADPASTGKAAA